MACLLEILSNEIGVSGNENKIRDIIIKEITPYADKIKIDTMGNVIAFKQGTSNKKIMLTAHMDEPGFIVSSITDSGYLKIRTVGTIDPRVIVSKRVLIGDNKIKGVIGMKAIHLQKKTERENTVSVSDLFVDIGAKNKKDALKTVKIGDFISFDTQFGDLGDNIKGKALNSRMGCVCLAELLKCEFEYDIYAVFAVQSEIEGRGALVAAYDIAPDTAIVISTVEAADMFGTKPHEKKAMLGKGAVVSYMGDRASFDGKAVLTAGNGTEVVNVAIPCRYSNTPVCIASKLDMDDAVEKITSIIKNGGELL